MNKAWRHFKTVMKHKAIVYQECKACGIWWQGVIHDLSKFSITEFLPSARYFQGNKSPIEAEKAEKGYSIAWLHHKGLNKHHWEWWTDFGKNGFVIANRMPKKYVIEMICDWIAAGKVYNKEMWTQASPLEYFEKFKSQRYLNNETFDVICLFLKVIKLKGLNTFHEVAKGWLKTKSYLVKE